MRAPASILPLRVENLAFEAEGKSLLGPMSFELPRGGITAIIGPNADSSCSRFGFCGSCG